jgi:hypothetical protein
MYCNIEYRLILDTVIPKDVDRALVTTTTGPFIRKSSHRHHLHLLTDYVSDCFNDYYKWY